MTEIALDIETVGLVDEPNFKKASDWTPFAIGLACRDGSGSVEGTVLFRENDSLEAERELLWNVVEWIGGRRPISSLMTYNGTSYDFRILAYRSRQCSQTDSNEELTVCSALCGLLEEFTHRDLIIKAKSLQEPHQKWPSLEEACASRGIEVEETIYEGRAISGRDMPEMGTEILTTPPSQSIEMREAVTQYALSDVTPLFELADCLEIERRESNVEPLAN